MFRQIGPKFFGEKISDVLKIASQPRCLWTRIGGVAWIENETLKLFLDYEQLYDAYIKCETCLIVYNVRTVKLNEIGAQIQ